MGNFKKDIKKRANALADYLAGMALKDIAEKYSVKMRTVVSWHTTDKWKEKKEELIEQYEKTVFSRYKKQIEESVNRSLEISRAGNHLCLLALKELLTECTNKKESPRNIVKELKEISVTAYKFSAIINMSMPSANEELSEKIHKELKELNEKVKAVIE